jgi:hypothetical protein
MPFLLISSIPRRRSGLTLDIRFKFPNIGPRNLGIDDISLGGDLSVWRSRKGDIPIDRWFVNYLKTYILARVLKSTIGRTVVKKHLTEFLCLFISWSLGSIDIIDMVFHISTISLTPSFPVQSTYSIKVGSARFIYHFSYASPHQALKATHNTNTPLGEGSPHLGLLIYGSRSHVGGVL